MRRLADDKTAAITYRGKARSRIASRLARCWPLLLIIALSHIAAAQQTATEKLGRQIPDQQSFDQQKLGRQIYVRGAGSGQESISAFIGDESMSIPASALPCASCHGDDGAGRPEGGVAPSDVRWQTLTKPYGVTHDSGRSHPAYTESSLKRAITQGVDPAGNQILVAMPRYRMPESDLSALVAYMQKLGEMHDPGLTSDAIRIGTVLPLSGPQAALGHDIESMLRAYFAEINRQGGIYSRKLELVVVDPGQIPHAMQKGCERLVEEDVFAVLGGLDGSPATEAEAFLAEREVPHVGPLTSFAPPTVAQNRWVFYVLADLRTQSQVLVDFALQQATLKQTGLKQTTFEQARLEQPGLKQSKPKQTKPKQPNFKQTVLSGRPGAIVYPSDEALLSSVAAMREQWKRGSSAAMSVLSYPSGRMESAALVRALRRHGVQSVFFLGSAHDEQRFAETAAKLGWTPNLLSLGPMSGDDIFHMPAAFRGKIFVSFPVLPPGPGQLRESELAALLQSKEVVLRHPALQLWAFRAARTLVEGLRLSGRQLSREKLLYSLEGLNDFDPGVGPKIAFGPNRRMGVLGAYVVGVDAPRKTFTPGEWLVPATEIAAGGNGYAK